MQETAGQKRRWLKLTFRLRGFLCLLAGNLIKSTLATSDISQRETEEQKGRKLTKKKKKKKKKKSGSTGIGNPWAPVGYVNGKRFLVRATFTFMRVTRCQPSIIKPPIQNGNVSIHILRLTYRIDRRNCSLSWSHYVPLTFRRSISYKWNGILSKGARHVTYLAF